MESTEYTALTRPQRQDIRASQRTFEGAYVRTALIKITFGMLILRVFSRDFVYIGLTFVVSALMTIGLALTRRAKSEAQLIDHPSTTFTTGGTFVAIEAGVDLASFTALIVLLQFVH